MISRRSYHKGEAVPPDFTKRYWFADIAHYYPGGFLEDVDVTCDTMDEVKVTYKEFLESTSDWLVIWDNREFKEIEQEKLGGGEE